MVAAAVAKVILPALMEHQPPLHMKRHLSIQWEKSIPDFVCALVQLHTMA